MLYKIKGLHFTDYQNGQRLGQKLHIKEEIIHCCFLSSFALYFEGVATFPVQFHSTPQPGKHVDVLGLK